MEVILKTVLLLPFWNFATPVELLCLEENAPVLVYFTQRNPATLGVVSLQQRLLLRDERPAWSSASFSLAPPLRLRRVVNIMMCVSVDCK